MATAAKVIRHTITLNMAELTKLDTKIGVMEKHGSTDSKAYRDASARSREVRACMAMWQQRYFALTGTKWTTVEMAEWDILDDERQARAQENRAALKKFKQKAKKLYASEYQQRITACENTLTRLTGLIHDTKNPVLRLKKGAKAREVAGAFLEDTGQAFTNNFMLLESLIPGDLERELLPKVRSQINKAKAALTLERGTSSFRKTHRHTLNAADLLNQGLAAMARYHSALGTAGKQAIAYIKWGSIAATAALTGGASSWGTVALSVSQKLGEESGAVFNDWVSGKKITAKDAKRIVRAMALAGATSCVSEVAGVLAGPIIKKLGGAKLSPAKLKEVKGAIGRAVGNNFERALQSIENSMLGKPDNFDWWASVIANMVPGVAGDSLKEKDVRDGLAATAGK